MRLSRLVVESDMERTRPEDLEGRAAPGFEVIDIGTVANAWESAGEKHNIHELMGRSAMVLCFYASWCPE